MREIKLYIAQSLDGCIAEIDGGLDWLINHENPEETDYGYADFYKTVDTLLMGARTYESILAMGIPWPYEDCQTYVVTHNPIAPQENISSISSNVVERIKQMKTYPGKDIWIVGGGELISTLLSHQLIDSMIITTIPVVLGGGIPLFRPISGGSNWSLSEVLTYKSGVVVAEYKLIRKK